MDSSDKSKTADGLLKPVWYTSRDGKTMGPFSMAEIIEQISSGRLTLLDLVYSDAASGWQLLSEVKIFQNAFQTRAVGRVRSPEQNRGEWIVLKAGADAASHVLGPFHQNEIFEMLSGGDVSYADSVWKPGEQEWVVIGKHPGFDRRPKVTETPKPILEFIADSSLVNQIPSQDLLVNVMKMGQPVVRQKVDDIPAEAEGVDLTKSILTIVSVCLLSAALGRSAFAHSLEIAALKSGTAKPVLMVQTDAPVGSVIHVELSVALGDVPNVSTFSKSLDVKREAGEVPTIDIETLGLPKGTFRATANLAGSDVKKTATFFNGEADPEFKLSDATFSKEVSFQQQAEKKALFYSSKKLAELAKKLRVNYPKLSRHRTRRKQFIVSWMKDFKEAEAAVTQISTSDGIAFPAERETFLNLVKDLKTEGERLGIKGFEREEASLAEPASAGNRAVASANSESKEALAALSKLEKNFDKLKEQASSASANN